MRASESARAARLIFRSVMRKGQRRAPPYWPARGTNVSETPHSHELRFFGGDPADVSPSRLRYSSPTLIGDGFLPRGEAERLWRYAASREHDFVASSTTTRVPGYRVSRVLPHFPEVAGVIRGRVDALTPELIRRFRLPPFKPGVTEVQLTAHNHGQFYRVHNDCGSPPTASRVISFVYYFGRQPSGFTGGHLRVFDALIKDGRWIKGPAAYEIAPVHNRIVFFLSRYHHEVLPVVCPSGQFADGRFTMNGWIRRAATFGRAR